MSGGWLSWDDGRLWLSDQEGRRRQAIDERVAANDIEQLGFAVGGSHHPVWQLLMPGDRGPRLFTSQTGEDWHQLPAAPLENPRDARVGLQPHCDQVSIIESGRLHCLDGTDSWRSVALPDGAQWAGVGGGAWWAIGSRVSTRVKNTQREVAAWRRADGASEWSAIPIRARWWDAYRAIRDGGFEDFRAVYSQGEPLVLASQCAWFLEDPSWFLFTRKSSGKFDIQRLRERELASIQRGSEGSPVVITTDGEIWDLKGRRWQPRGTAEPLWRALGWLAGSGQRRVQLALVVDEIYGLTVRFERGRGKQQFAVRSRDGGQSWSARAPEGESRLIAAWAIP